MSGTLGVERAGDWIVDHVAIVAVVAVALGLLVPSSGLASDSNVLLAVLVLFTAAQIDPRRLRELRRRAALIAAIGRGTPRPDSWRLVDQPTLWRRRSQWRSVSGIGVNRGGQRRVDRTGRG